MLPELCLALLLLALPCTSQQNYQERYIYMGQDNNVCVYGDQSDRFNLLINLDESEIIRTIARGGTLCYTWYIANQIAIEPAQTYNYVDAYKGHLIQFQEQTDYRPYPFVTLIVQKTTVKSVKLYGKDCDCVIWGDGKVQHFGIDFKDKEPATIKIKCTSRALTTEE